MASVTMTFEGEARPGWGSVIEEYAHLPLERAVVLAAARQDSGPRIPVVGQFDRRFAGFSAMAALWCSGVIRPDAGAMIGGRKPTSGTDLLRG